MAPVVSATVAPTQERTSSMQSTSSTAGQEESSTGKPLPISYQQREGEFYFTLYQLLVRPCVFLTTLLI